MGTTLSTNRKERDEIQKLWEEGKIQEAQVLYRKLVKELELFSYDSEFPGDPSTFVDCDRHVERALNTMRRELPESASEVLSGSVSVPALVVACFLNINPEWAPIKKMKYIQSHLNEEQNKLLSDFYIHIQEDDLAQKRRKKKRAEEESEKERKEKSILPKKENDSPKDDIRRNLDDDFSLSQDKKESEATCGARTRD